MHPTKDCSFLIVQLSKENLMQQRHLMLMLQQLRYGCIGQKIGLLLHVTLVCTIKGRNLTQKRDFNDHLAAPVFSERYNCTLEKLVFIDCIMKHRKLDATKRFDAQLVAAPLFAAIRMHPPKNIVFFSKLLVDQSCWGIFVQ